MKDFHKHIACVDTSISTAFKILNNLSSDAILFLVENNNKLVGSLTDGDLRRGFINGLGLNDHLSKFMNSSPKYILIGDYDFSKIKLEREKLFLVFPIVNEKMQIVDIVNFKYQKSYLPIDALIMAGGRGERLRPLTDTIPKPLLIVGDKPIIEHNIDRLKVFGIDDIWISINYLGDQLVNYFRDGSDKSLNINYVKEENALGTAGALSLIDNFSKDYVLLMNSDLLTNIDFEDFYIFFQENDADFAVACIPYQVNIPYAVMEAENKFVTGFKEKPTYTHYSNAGIYLMKKEIVKKIPKGKKYDATDLMQELITGGLRVVAYPLVDYWLDIGKHEDFKKAQIDISRIKF